MSEYELGNRLTKQISKLQTELDESRAKNKQCICMFCHEVMPRPDDDEATATMLVDHAYNCKKHPVAKLQAEVTRLEGILGGLVLPENYCGSDGREVELIVPIEVYDEACEIALKENEK